MSAAADSPELTAIICMTPVVCRIGLAAAAGARSLTSISPVTDTSRPRRDI